MRGKRWYGILALILVLLVTVAGCNTAPQKKMTPNQAAPPAPQKQTAQGTEPEITVFMHETNEKKSMKMEEYIAGVVAGEMKPEWPVEALAAQAILARTFTMEAIESKGGVPARGTQASTDIKEFQAYDAKAITENVRKAGERLSPTRVSLFKAGFMLQPAVLRLRLKRGWLIGKRNLPISNRYSLQMI